MFLYLQFMKEKQRRISPALIFFLKLLIQKLTLVKEGHLGENDCKFCNLFLEISFYLQNMI